MADTQAQKTDFLNQIKALMTRIGGMVEDSATMSAMYVDRGYDSAAADPVTDEDLNSYGVVQYDLATVINLLQQIEQLYLGNATAPSPTYKVSLNKWRSV